MSSSLPTIIFPVNEEPVTIRPINDHDSIQDITELLHRAYAPLAAMGLRFHATHQDADTTRARLNSGEAYVAVRKDKLVGTIALRLPGTATGCEWYARKDVCVFGQFAVEPRLQKLGIGSRLLDLVESRAKELHASELALDTAEGAKHLLAYYERRGYRHVGRVDWEVTNYVSVILSKPLED